MKGPNGSEDLGVLMAVISVMTAKTSDGRLALMAAGGSIDARSDGLVVDETRLTVRGHQMMADVLNAVRAARRSGHE